MESEAAVVRQPDGPFLLERVVVDDPGRDEVLVQVLGVGMCHTDLGLVKSRPPTTPIILGHEGAGIVEAVGPGVTGLAVGDPVVMSFDSCGVCRLCRGGHPAYCDHFGSLNIGGRRPDGTGGARDASGAEIAARFFGQSSFAQYALATVRNVVKLDRDLPVQMLGPLGCGIQTGAASVIVAMGVRPGDSLAVFGAGAVGLAAVMAARVAGAATILAVDLLEARRDLALELGATHVLDGADPDLADQIRSVSPDGVGYAFDTTGVPSVILTALGSLATCGFCGLVAGRGELVISPGALSAGRKLSSLLEGDAVPQTFIPHMIQLWRQGRFPFDRLIKTYPLEQINQAEADSLSGSTVKPVLIP